MSNRIALWDNLKFILITLVVAGHFADQLTDYSSIYSSIYLFIYAFHMPLFIFISGYFHSDRNTTKKVLFYTSLGFLYKIVSFLIDRLNGDSQYIFNLLADSGLAWFMFVLAIYTFVLFLLKDQNKKFILIGSIILACFAGYDKSIGDFLYLSRAIIFFPFYILGTMMKSFDILEFKRKYPLLKVFALLIFVTWVILCITKVDTLYGLRYMFSGRQPFPDGIISFGPIVRLACYIISAVLGISLILLTTSKKIKWISDFGKNTINVYFWHLNLFYIFKSFIDFNSIYSSFSFGFIVYTIATITVTVILSTKIFNFPVNILKKQIFM
ncbi:acyltransferase family protein [Gemella sanguinis]|jgi:hypothetical protein|uniref:Acyltransferase n=1 Tax=Gemella sanguinis TaxID=84135 RepID=A0A2N6SES9_9BACL|nr:acyltransferase family protein [Gemella sanguinis]PMC52462.1 acyltransferase [Gemella sanguinis]